MKVLEQYEENNYLITKYENGAIVKEIIPKEIQYEPTLNENELKQIEFEEKIEYITTLLELQGGLINV